MSLKGDKYENMDEVKARLEGSVVLYDGEPVYITGVRNPQDALDGVARVYVSPLPYDPNHRSERKLISSKKFDLTPFKMGYMLHPVTKKPIKISRSPVRQYKQGLTGNTIAAVDVAGKPVGLDFIELIQSKEFYDLIKGNFRNFSDAVKIVKDVESVAVGRDYLLRKHEDIGLVILYKGNQACGYVGYGDNKVTIAPKYHFLTQELTNNMISHIISKE